MQNTIFQDMIVQDMGDTMGMLTGFAVRGLNILGSLVLLVLAAQ